MRKVIKSAGKTHSLGKSYDLISTTYVPISTLDYPAARFAEGLEEKTSTSSYMGVSKIYFRKNKRSLPEGMSKSSKLIQNLRDPD